MSDTPAWVLDLLADLLDEEDIHPKLYYQSFDGEKYHPYCWCPAEVLAKVPDQALAQARGVAAYRRIMAR